MRGIHYKGSKSVSAISVVTPHSRSCNVWRLAAAAENLRTSKDSLNVAESHRRAWLYPRVKTSPSVAGPAIVLGHGIGAIKEMGLDRYCAFFSSQGYTCFAFDYRFCGESTGKPRSLVDVSKQLEDWHSAIDYVRLLPDVDPEQIAIFGSSFGGGHAMQVGKTDPRVKAIIAQCPFTNGFRSALCAGIATAPSLMLLGIRDYLFGTSDDPVRVALTAEPGGVALMNSPDAVNGYREILPPGIDHLSAIPARILLRLPFLRPGSAAEGIKAPIYFAVCGKDNVTPPEVTLKYARKAAKGTIKVYEEMGHFDIYVGKNFDIATKDYLAFLQKNLPS